MALMGGSIFQHKKRNEAGRVNRFKSSLSDLNESFSLFAVENFLGFRKLDHGTYLGLKFIGIVMTRTLPFAITSFSVVSTETRICSYVCSLLHPPTGSKPMICEKNFKLFFFFPSHFLPFYNRLNTLRNAFFTVQLVVLRSQAASGEITSWNFIRQLSFKVMRCHINH